VKAYKTIARTLQKRAGKRQVWLLHWNEAIGWMKWSLFPAFFVWIVNWGKDGTGEMELGQEIALMEGKEPLLPWVQIRLMSAASGLSDRFR